MGFRHTNTISHRSANYSVSLTQIHTQKNVNKNEVQHASSNMDLSVLDGVYITLQARVMDITATVVIEIITPHLLSWELSFSL